MGHYKMATCITTMVDSLKMASEAASGLVGLF